MAYSVQEQQELLAQILAAAHDPEIPGMLKNTRMELVAFEPEARALTLSYPCLEWEISPRKNMQGGMLSMLFDMSMGTLAALYAQEAYLTTLELTTRFIHPVRLGEVLHIRTELISRGKTILNLRSTAVSVQGELLGAAEGTFMLVKSLKNDYMG